MKCPCEIGKIEGCPQDSKCPEMLDDREKRKGEFIGYTSLYAILPNMFVFDKDMLGCEGHLRFNYQVFSSPETYEAAHTPDCKRIKITVEEV